MKSVLCCAKISDCCYQILHIMIQIKTCLGNAVAVYSIEAENIPIFTWLSAMLWELMFLNNSQTELFPLQQLMTSQTNAVMARTLLQTSFFNDYYPGWQLARKVVHPQLQSINLTLHLLSMNSRPALLIKQRCLSGRISSAWWSPTVRPEHSERRDLGCQIVRLVRCYSSNKYGDYV